MLRRHGDGDQSRQVPNGENRRLWQFSVLHRQWHNACMLRLRLGWVLEVTQANHRRSSVHKELDSQALVVNSASDRACIGRRCAIYRQASCQRNEGLEITWANLWWEPWDSRMGGRPSHGRPSLQERSWQGLAHRSCRAMHPERLERGEDELRRVGVESHPVDILTQPVSREVSDRHMIFW